MVIVNVVVFQSLSRVQLFATPWTTAHQASLSVSISQSLLKLMSIESVMPSNHLILCHPLILEAFSLSQHQGLFHCGGSDRIRWPKYWRFSFSISPSNEYSGLIYFGIDWLDLLAVQGTLKSLIQHHNSKASVPWCSALYMVQRTSIHECWKTIALIIWTFVGKVMSLLYHILSNLS